MQAYNKRDLYNAYLQQQGSMAFETNCISKETYAKILKVYPSKLYTPNYFIRIALGLLTIVAVLFSGLLLWLLLSGANTPGITMVLIILSAICYATVELLVKGRQYYNAGVDNVLMIMMMVFIISAFLVSDSGTSWLVISSIAMCISLWLCIRFTDAFMAMVSYCCLFLFLFLFYIKAGNAAKATAPFMMMAVSAIVYWLMKKLTNSRSFMYRFCFKAVTVLTLLTFYAAGNYFIVKELSNQMFHLKLQLADAVPFGWLFWVFTIAIPCGYIIYGAVKKDLLMMRTGLVLVAAAVFTVRYYYEILPAEVAMLIAGVLIIAMSYALIRYLKSPKYGYTSDDLYPLKKSALNVEALIIAETFSPQTTASDSGLYGGGSGGGGGASGEY